jgi:hypothetical protein
MTEGIEVTTVSFSHVYTAPRFVPPVALSHLSTQHPNNRVPSAKVSPTLSVWLSVRPTWLPPTTSPASSSSTTTPS